MIGSIRGILRLKKPPILLVEVGGIGYELLCPISTHYQLPDLQREVFLHTHLVVREDAHLLYGFYKEQERNLFRSLIKVSNVGPKLALAILSGIDVDQFVKCVVEQNIQPLIGLPGVGKKTAERLMIELRGKLTELSDDLIISEIASVKVTNSVLQDGISALIALGFKPQEASRAISQVKENYVSAEDLIKLALQNTYRN